MARQLEENGIKLRAPEPEDLDCWFRSKTLLIYGISVIPQDLTPVSI